MPTKINKPFTRETAVTIRDAGRDRVICIEVHPTHIEAWPKNTNYRLRLPIDKMWRLMELRSEGMLRD
tara:strand:- start:11937 stop:12140 length:204 start_codon:yes stop_codon:yes gene_type:complete